MTAGLTAAGGGPGSLMYIIAAVLAIVLVAAILLIRGRRTRAGTARSAARPDGRRFELPVPNRRRRAARRHRSALWRAVRAAEFAVLAAQQAGTAAGNLDAMYQGLRLAAQDVDHYLFPAPPGPSPLISPVLSRCAINDLIAAAGLIEDAAAFAAESQSRPDASEDNAFSQAITVLITLARARLLLIQAPAADS